MSLLKKKVLWFTLYGIFITVVFLYLLFPSALVQSRLEEDFNSPDFILKMESLQPSLPLGLKLKNATLSSGSPANIYFQGDSLDLQFNPVSFFQKNKSIGLSGRAYGGDFDGRVGLSSLSKIYPPVEGKLKFKNINLAGCALIKTLLAKEITGKAKGSMTYTSAKEISGNSSGTISIFLTKGTYPLAEPFLGLNRIEFDRGEIQAQLKNGSLKMEKLEISGPQINCFLKGEITLTDTFKLSQLNLNGVMEILGQNKAKMNVTISGTLADPIFRYI
ncbi:MAG: type II secretion system protein GspN [Deltaproteobacteria bacterium]|nr:type II secretion system protein GspN [Deltaproteobacteria bacterium]